MDHKDLGPNCSVSTSVSDGSTKFSLSSPTLQTSRNKSYDGGSNTFGKVDAPTTRPCAIIGPDRVLPPNPDDTMYLKKMPGETWPSSDNVYRRPPDYPTKIPDYQPTRNISPRQTFQENMQRILVPPTFTSLKTSEDNSLKNVKISLPQEAKYCDVPYNINSVNGEPKSVRSSDIPIPNVNPPYTRNVPPPYGWPAGVNVRPIRPYGAPEFYQYQEFPSCAGPRPVTMIRPHRPHHEDSAQMYPEQLYQDANIRFKPYSTGKEKHPQPRYDYVNNYPSTFHPPASLPPHKYDIQKTVHNHPYSIYPQVPFKYFDRRIHETFIDGYHRTHNQQSNFNSFHGQVVLPPYGPIPGNCMQNKTYADISPKPVNVNKLQFENNNKVYLNLESRNKNYAVPENLYYNDIPHSQQLRDPPLLQNHSIPPLPLHSIYRKDNTPLKPHEYNPNYRFFDQSVNVNNSLQRLPLQFSPNPVAMSPSDSNTSNDTAHTIGISQEDCGYVSQSSTASMRSMESGNISIPHDFYRRYSYNNYDFPRNPFQMNCPVQIPKNKTEGSHKKNINVRQFLQMWNEGEEEGNEGSKDTAAQINSTNFSSKSEITNNQEQLYVLGLVNVPNEELGKYDHIQKISKLPENIKGYNNIEILNQYEELLETPHSGNHNKVKTSRDFNPRSLLDKEFIPKLPRPLSPLDVEAKISQSVIHKEVGCNFEIKPCSPVMLNVEIATPVQTILGERMIEKVINPIMTKSPNLAKNENIKSPKSLNDSAKITSCKMVTNQYLSKNSPNTTKPSNNIMQDLENNSGLCLASLPQLDNVIELNFPEINQQFIKANQMEPHISSSLQNLPNLDLEQSHSSFPMDNKSDCQKHSTNDLPSGLAADREFSKLSKYRKGRNTTKQDYSQLIESTPVQRIDSVIIKNPDNIKSLDMESVITESETYNIEKKNEVNCSNAQKETVIERDEFSSETALDFSLSRSEDETAVIYLNEIESNINQHLPSLEELNNTDDISSISSVQVQYSETKSNNMPQIDLSKSNMLETNLTQHPENMKDQFHLINDHNHPLETSKNYTSNEKYKTVRKKEIAETETRINNISLYISSANETSDESNEVLSCQKIDEVSREQMESKKETPESEKKIILKTNNGIDNSDNGEPAVYSLKEQVEKDIVHENPTQCNEMAENFIGHNYTKNHIVEKVTEVISSKNTIDLNNKNNMNLELSIKDDISETSLIRDKCYEKVDIDSDNPIKPLVNFLDKKNALKSEQNKSNVNQGIDLMSENVTYEFDVDINKENPEFRRNIEIIENECSTNIKETTFSLTSENNTKKIVDDLTQSNQGICFNATNLIQSNVDKTDKDACEIELSMPEVSNDFIESSSSLSNETCLVTQVAKLGPSQDDSATVLIESELEFLCTTPDMNASKDESEQFLLKESDAFHDSISNLKEQKSEKLLKREEEISRTLEGVKPVFDATGVQNIKNVDDVCFNKKSSTEISSKQIEERSHVLDKSYNSLSYKTNTEIFSEKLDGKKQEQSESYVTSNNNNTEVFPDNVEKRKRELDVSYISSDNKKNTENFPENVSEIRRELDIIDSSISVINFDLNDFNFEHTDNTSAYKHETKWSTESECPSIQDCQKYVEKEEIQHKENSTSKDYKKFQKKQFCPWMQKLLTFTEGACKSIKDAKYNFERFSDSLENHTLSNVNRDIPREFNDMGCLQSTLEINKEFLINNNDLNEKDHTNNTNSLIDNSSYINTFQTACHENQNAKQDNEKFKEASLQQNKSGTQTLNELHHCTIIKPRKISKRSLSESAIDEYNDIDVINAHQPCKRRKGLKDAENFVESHVITEDLCNLIQTNRRNSISTFYNEENVYIVIDNDLILTDADDDTAKLCYTNIDDEFVTNVDSPNYDLDHDLATDSIPDDLNSCEYRHTSRDVAGKTVEDSWVDDVACIETILSEDVAENIIIDVQASPKKPASLHLDDIEHETNAFYESDHIDKIKNIYGCTMYNDNTQLIETLYRTPQMDVNKTLYDIESQSPEDCLTFNGFNESNESVYLDKESLFEDIIESEEYEPQNAIQNCKDSNTNINCDDDNQVFSTVELQPNSTIQSCESSNDYLTSTVPKENPNYSYSSSPEVSSTTSEDKTSSILLKITNCNGSRVSQVNEISSDTRTKLSYKLTEKRQYREYSSSRTLITKAAQKYIPPLKEKMYDLKVKLALPQHRLNTLKQLKIAKIEPKTTVPTNNGDVKRFKCDKLKKQKPKFEDVLKSIDEINYKRHKDKKKKSKSSIPKVVIKKNENGAHYASSKTVNDSYNPDLTGRKWQPWVFLEKDNFIDSMVVQNKIKAVFCHRKNCYVLAEKFRKYKSVYNANFVITQPAMDTSTKGNLKYTIRLKHS